MSLLLCPYRQGRQTRIPWQGFHIPILTYQWHCMQHYSLLCVWHTYQTGQDRNRQVACHSRQTFSTFCKLLCLPLGTSLLSCVCAFLCLCFSLSPSRPFPSSCFFICFCCISFGQEFEHFCMGRQAFHTHGPTVSAVPLSFSLIFLFEHDLRRLESWRDICAVLIPSLLTALPSSFLPLPLSCTLHTHTTHALAFLLMGGWEKAAAVLGQRQTW